MLSRTHRHLGESTVNKAALTCTSQQDWKGLIKARKNKRMFRKTFIPQFPKLVSLSIYFYLTRLLFF